MLTVVASLELYLLSNFRVRGGGGGGNRGRVTTCCDCRKGRGHEKWAVKRGRVMQICVRDHVEVHPQRKREVLYFVEKNLGEIGELSDQLSESESDS